MGVSGAKPNMSPVPPLVKVPVTLHIYDLGTSGALHALNAILRPLGSALVHVGVEVYGREWSFSASDGVFACGPKSCDGHSYSDSLCMGGTSATQHDVSRVIRLLQRKWPLQEYDVLCRNCCHFSNALCLMLGVGGIPSWALNLAEKGAILAEAGEQLLCCSKHNKRRFPFEDEPVPPPPSARKRVSSDASTASTASTASRA